VVRLYHRNCKQAKRTLRAKDKKEIIKLNEGGCRKELV
jgi:hypothetical protein